MSLLKNPLNNAVSFSLLFLLLQHLTTTPCTGFSFFMGSSPSVPLAEVPEDLVYPHRDEEGYSLAYEKNGRWYNWWGHDKPGGLGLVAKFFFQKDNSNIPSSEKDLNATLPVQKPYWVTESNGTSKFGSPGIRVTWLGHASVLAEIDGAVVLADPIFSQRCSASQYFGPKRFRPPPCTVEDIPRLDAVVISHSHYDHLDFTTVKQLQDKFGDDLQWYVPSGLGSWVIDNLNAKSSNVHDMVWWDEKTLPNSSTKVAFTPSNHWSRRGAFDENKVLWGSWTVIGPQHKFFFGGDTAYCEAFKQIGRKYGPIDVSAIPIGAYEPRKFFKDVHVDPEEAVQIHKDIQSQKSIGIHWGTFKLTFEYYLEPREVLPKVLKEQGVPEDEFFCINMGETFES